MTIDTEKEFCLTNFAQIKSNKKAIQSDHCPMKLEINIQYSHIKPQRIEHFNLRNKKCQESFKNETEKTSIFENCFKINSTPLTQIKTWQKKFNQIIHKSFKKIRVNVHDNKKMKSKALHLQEERSKLIKLVKKDNKYIDTDKEQVIMKARIKDIEQEIGEENAKHNLDKIKSLEVLGGESDCINTNGMCGV